MNKPRKGLNVVQFVGYKYEPDGKYGAYAQMIFNVGGRKQWNFIGEPGDSFRRYGKEIDDPKQVEDYRKEIFTMLARPAKALLGAEKVDEALAGINNFKDYVLTLKGLIDSTEDTTVDLFLQYQYSIKKGQDRTWLEIPNDETNGPFVAKHTGEFEQKYNKPYNDKTVDALTYENDKGERHPFYRSGWFIESNYWKPQGVTIREGSKPETPSTSAPAAEPKGFDDDIPF